jgi:hypothetical protein
VRLIAFASALILFGTFAAAGGASVLLGPEGEFRALFGRLEYGKFKIVFSEPAKPLPKQIPFANAPTGAMQGVRYTTKERLITAETVKDLV